MLVGVVCLVGNAGGLGGRERKGSLVGDAGGGGREMGTGSWVAMWEGADGELGRRVWSAMREGTDESGRGRDGRGELGWCGWGCGAGRGELQLRRDPELVVGRVNPFDCLERW